MISKPHILTCHSPCEINVEKQFNEGSLILNPFGSYIIHVLLSDCFVAQASDISHGPLVSLIFRFSLIPQQRNYNYFLELKKIHDFCFKISPFIWSG